MRFIHLIYSLGEKIKCSLGLAIAWPTVKPQCCTMNTNWFLVLYRISADVLTIEAWVKQQSRPEIEPVTFSGSEPARAYAAPRMQIGQRWPTDNGLHGWTHGRRLADDGKQCYTNIHNTSHNRSKSSCEWIRSAVVSVQSSRRKATLCCSTSNPGGCLPHTISIRMLSQLGLAI